MSIRGLQSVNLQKVYCPKLIFIWQDVLNRYTLYTIYIIIRIRTGVLLDGFKDRSIIVFDKNSSAWSSGRS